MNGIACFIVSTTTKIMLHFNCLFWYVFVLFPVMFHFKAASYERAHQNVKLTSDMNTAYEDQHAKRIR
jgi:hypothetical protein